MPGAIAGNFSHITEDLNEKTTLYRSSVRVSTNTCRSFGAEAGSTTELQSRKMLRDREGRQERLRINWQQFLRRFIQSQRRSKGLDLRAGRLLRTHRWRQQDFQIGTLPRILGGHNDIDSPHT
jgi:hypothetical protein